MKNVITFNDLSIEQVREIVEGAPDGATHYRTDFFGDMRYLKAYNDKWFAWNNYDSGLNRWRRLHYINQENYEFMQLQAFELNDLRAAIASHDSEQLCIGCGSPDLHNGGEIKEPKMCIDCFAEMVGFTRVGDKFVETDDLAAGHRIDSNDTTDIRNHVGSSCEVKNG